MGQTGPDLVRVRGLTGVDISRGHVGKGIVAAYRLGSGWRAYQDSQEENGHSQQAPHPVSRDKRFHPARHLSFKGFIMRRPSENLE
jgi:hypothetical protein